MDTHHVCERGCKHRLPDPSPIYQERTLAPEVYIVDVDGTLALREPLADGLIRCPYGTDLVITDAPNQGVIDLLNLVCNPFSGPGLIFVTGRLEAARDATRVWLQRYFDRKVTHLYMRPDGNQESDVDLKLRIYQDHIEADYRVLGVFDDRASVCAMWRSLGLLVYQAAPGNF